MMNFFPQILKRAGLPLVMGLSLGVVPLASAQESSSAQQNLAQRPASQRPDANKAVMSTVRQGLPNKRAAAATRGTEDELIVLAPTHTPWLSLAEEPSLLVYIGERQKGRILEVLVETEEGEYVYDKFFEVPDQVGLFKLELEGSLPEQRLNVGQQYLWQISLISDLNNRSSDRYVHGDLQRISSPDLPSAQRLRSEDLSDEAITRADFFQSVGLWQEAAVTLYDLLQTPNLPLGQQEQAQERWVALLNSLDLQGLGQQPLPQAELTEIAAPEDF